MPVSFHDVRLPTDIERGATGGPAFLTDSGRIVSGQRRTRINWTQPLGGYDIGYGIQSLETLDVVRHFFYCRYGSAYAFRFKDWGDYQIARQEIAVAAGGAEAIQLIKTYSDGTYSFEREVQLPISGTLQVWINSVLGTEGVDYTVDYSTGLISGTFTGGHSIEAACEFDVPCAFERDEFNVNVQTFANGSVPKLPLTIERL